MAIQGADIVAIATLGVLENYTGAGGGEVPAAPTISSVVDNGDQDAITVTIAGATGTVNLYYRIYGATAWTTGLTRSGSGTIVQTGLIAGSRYEVYVTQTIDEMESPPSAIHGIYIALAAGVTPTGEFGLAVYNLRSLLAESSTFWTEISATGTDAEKKIQALTKIHVAEYWPDDAFERPFMVISRAGDDGSESIAATAYGASGTLHFTFERTIPAEFQDQSDSPDAELNFLEIVDGIMSDCQALSGSAGYLLTRSWRIADGPSKIENTNIYWVEIAVAWGLSGD